MKKYRKLLALGLAAMLAVMPVMTAFAEAEEVTWQQEEMNPENAPEEASEAGIPEEEAPEEEAPEEETPEEETPEEETPEGESSEEEKQEDGEQEVSVNTPSEAEVPEEAEETESIDSAASKADSADAAASEEKDAYWEDFFEESDGRNAAMLPAEEAEEDLSLRTANTKTFVQADGSRTLVMYNTDIHYAAKDGSWQEIDNTLTDMGDSYVGGDGAVKFSFAKDQADGWTELTRGETSLRFRYASADTESEKQPAVAQAAVRKASASTAEAASVSEEESEDESEEVSENCGIVFESKTVTASGRESDAVSYLVYENALGTADLMYKTQGSGLKENIVLWEKQDSYTWKLEVETEGLEIRSETDGSYRFLDQKTGETVYVIPAPVMTDSAGAESSRVWLSLQKQQNGKAEFRLTANADWINSEDREFPVMIDPTFEAERHITVWNVCSNPYETNPGQAAVVVGARCYDKGGDNKGINRSYLSLSDLPEIPEGSVIADASISFVQYEFRNQAFESFPAAAYALTGTFTTGFNWDNQPEYSSEALDYQILSDETNSSWQTWNITTLIKEHYESGSTKPVNFVIKAVNDDGENSIFKDCAYEEGAVAYLGLDNTAATGGVEPVLSITYRNIRGVESALSYNSQGAGAAGTGYVSDYSGQLTIARTLYTTTNSAFPFTISAVYNSGIGRKQFTEDDVILTKDYSSMQLGAGWKLSVQQSIVPRTLGERDFLVYCDGDGTEHWFSESEEENEYEDEDGLGLTVIVDGSNFTMRDKKGNESVFYNGYLGQITDTSGNQIMICYNGKAWSEDSTDWQAQADMPNRVTSVVQKNNGAASAEVAAFAYNEQNELTGITDRYGKTWAFTYKHSDDGKTYLEKITNPSGTWGEYRYSEGNLEKTLDSASLQGISYVWGTDGTVSAVSEILWKNNKPTNKKYTQGRKLSIKRNSLQSVTYTDNGIDAKDGTDDDIVREITFDFSGRAVSTTTRAAAGESAGNSAVTYTEGEDATANRVSVAAGTGAAASNLLANGSMETVENVGEYTVISGWETVRARKYGEISEMASGPCTEQHRTGEWSYKAFIPDHTDASDIYCTAWKEVQLTAGKNYTFSAYMKCTNEEGNEKAFEHENAKIYLQFGNARGNCVSRGEYIRDYTDENCNDGWTRLYVSYQPSVTGTYCVMARSSGIQGSVYFDDFQLEEGGAASTYDILGCGSFEWNEEPAAWEMTEGAEIIENEEYAVQGGSVLRLAGKPETEVAASYTVNLNAPSAETYVLSGFVDGRSVCSLGTDEESEEKSLRLEAVLTYSDGSTETHPIYIPVTTGKRYVSKGIVPEKKDETVSTTQIRCVYEGGLNTVYFDGVLFSKGSAVEYEYDDSGNMTRAIYGGGRSIEYEYYDAEDDPALADLVKQTTSTTGTSTAFTYDTVTRNLLTTTANGVTTSLTYDERGHVTQTVVSAEDEKEIITSSTYTPFIDGYENFEGEFLKTVTDQTGSTTTYTTSPRTGLTTKITDESGTSVSYQYNAQQKLQKSKVSADGKDLASITYTYDSAGRVTDMLRKALLPNGTTIRKQSYRFTYNAYGSILSIGVGSSQNLVTYTYLPKNGPVKTVSYGNGGLSYVTSYEYDCFGRLTEEKRDGKLLYAYVYGADGSVAKIREYSEDGQLYKETGYEYDDNGSLVMSYENTRSDGHMLRTSMTSHVYDDMTGKLNQNSWDLSGIGSGNETYTYDAAGRLSSFTSALKRNGSTGTTNTGSAQYSYDGLGRLETKTAKSRKKTVVSSVYTYLDLSETQTTTQLASLQSTFGEKTLGWNYTYDASGRITQVSETETAQGTERTDYTYDAQGRLITAAEENTNAQGNMTVQRTSAYVYDTAGNLQSVSENGSTVRTFRYSTGDWKDQLISVKACGKTGSLTYDGMGNPLSYFNGENYTFTWQSGHDLSKAVTNGVTAEYAYNAEGIRTEKTVTENGKTITYKYTYLGRTLTAMTVSDGKQTSLYTFTYDASGHPFSMTRQGTVYYYICNMQGDVLKIVKKDGTVVAEYEYDAWGMLESDDTGNTVELRNPLRYRGYQYDRETGFYYLESRYYDPANCRFISADSLISFDLGIDGFNLYAYCNSNPVSYSDSSGNRPTSRINGTGSDLDYWYENGMRGSCTVTETWVDSDGCTQSITRKYTYMPDSAVQFCIENNKRITNSEDLVGDAFSLGCDYAIDPVGDRLGDISEFLGDLFEFVSYFNILYDFAKTCSDLFTLGTTKMYWQDAVKNYNGKGLVMVEVGMSFEDGYGYQGGSEYTYYINFE